MTIIRRPCPECIASGDPARSGNHVAVSLMDGNRTRHRCTSCGYLWYQDDEGEPEREVPA